MEISRAEKLRLALKYISDASIQLDTAGEIMAEEGIFGKADSVSLHESIIPTLRDWAERVDKEIP